VTGATGAPGELLRALGAFADGPADARTAAAALGLAPPSAAEHTDAFVLNCPPYAAVYLGPDGALGGEGADRAAGFWRAIGITPPAEPDHLTALLSLYASLRDAAGEARRPATASALARSAAALFHEHLWPWLPAYLDAVGDLAIPAVDGWAALTRRVLAAERAAWPTPSSLPLALRSAPGQAGPGGRLSDLTAALTTPACSGIILTRRRLAGGAGEAHVGHRIGERRFALRAMLDQDPAATLGWLGQEAARWQRRHAGRAPGDAVGGWWSERAGRTAEVLLESAGRIGEAAVAG
jgi:hypothetical protein